MRPAPEVYRYICPDGRSYVGSVADHHKRDRHGLYRFNSWIGDALVTHPPRPQAGAANARSQFLERDAERLVNSSKTLYVAHTHKSLSLPESCP
jgi:hypothetical protein